MKTAYPAIMHEENGRCWVEFPDLEGCFSDGDTIAEAAVNAQEALGAYICSLMEREMEAPAASDIRKVTAGDGFATLVATDTLKYRRSTRTIKKTLTIPEWLNTEAEKRHVNFSSVLRQALISMLD